MDDIARRAVTDQSNLIGSELIGSGRVMNYKPRHLAVKESTQVSDGPCPLYLSKLK